MNFVVVDYLCSCFIYLCCFFLSHFVVILPHFVVILSYFFWYFTSFFGRFEATPPLCCSTQNLVKQQDFCHPDIWFTISMGCKYILYPFEAILCPFCFPCCFFFFVLPPFVIILYHRWVASLGSCFDLFFCRSMPLLVILHLILHLFVVLFYLFAVVWGPCHH